MRQTRPPCRDRAGARWSSPVRNCAATSEPSVHAHGMGWRGFEKPLPSATLLSTQTTIVFYSSVNVGVWIHKAVLFPENNRLCHNGRPSATRTSEGAP
jgi:hypothetical protein